MRIFLFFAWCLTAFGQSAEAADWPQFQSDPGKTGVNSAERFSQLEPKFTLELLNFGQATQFNIATAIAVGNTIFVGTNEAALIAVGKKSGTQVWKVNVNGPVRGAPLFVDDKVVLADSAGFLTAVNPNDGTPIWTYDSASNFYSSPTVAQVANESRIFLGAANGTVHCVKAETGGTVWIASTGAAIWSSPSVSETNSRVYVSSYDQRVYAIDAVNGTIKWITDPSLIPLGPLRASVAVKDSRLYVPTLSRGLVALNDNGFSVSEAWRVSLTGSHTGSAAVVSPSGLLSATTIYVANTVGEVFAIEDRGTFSKTLWQHDLVPSAAVVGSVAFADDLVFVASEDGKLRALDALLGDELLIGSTTAAIDSSMAISNGNVYVADATGRLYSFGNELEPPEGLSAIADDGGNVVLSWDPVLLPPLDQPVSGYNIYRSQQPDKDFVPIAFVDGLDQIILQSTSIFIDTSVTVTGTYFYAITGLEDVAGTPALEESTFSNIASVAVTVSIPTVLPVVSGLIVQPGDGVINLNWNVTAGDFPVSLLDLFRREGTSGPLLLFRTLAAGTNSFDDIRVENRVEYSYAVVAIDANGDAGPQSAQVSATPFTIDWPMFQRDVLHEAFDPGQDISPPLGERWRVKLSEGPFNPGGAFQQGFSGYQGGLIVSGTLYVASVGGDVRAYNAETGTTLWFESGFANILASPAYHNGRLYITHNDGLTVLKADTGVVDWALPRAVVGFGAESSPIIYKGVLYAGMGVGFAPRLVAIDIETRTVKWISEPRTVFLKSSPGAARGKIYIVDGGGNVNAYDADNGDLLWSRRLGAFVTTTEGISLAVCPPVVLVAHENSFLHAFDADTGALKWRERVFSRFTSPAVAGATVFVASHNVNTVYARNVVTGALVWKAFTFSGRASHGAPVVANGRLHVYATNGQVFTLDLFSGAKLDVVQLTNVDLRTSHLSAGAGQLYVPTINAKLIAVTPVTAAPTNLTALGLVEKVSLGWAVSTPNQFAVSAYRVFRSSVAGDPGSIVADVPGATTTIFTDTTMTLGQQFFYSVAAVDVRGVVGRISDQVAARAFFQPNIVAQISDPLDGIFVCVVPIFTFTVTGTATSGNFSRYTLELDEGGGFVTVVEEFSPVINNTLGIVTLTTSGLPNLRLTAFDETGQSGVTQVSLNAPATTLDAQVTWPVLGQIIFTDCMSFTLTLTGVATADDFVEYRLEAARLSSSLVAVSSLSSTTSVDTVGGLGSVTLPDCDDYVIRLIVQDVCGRTRTVEVTLELQGSEFLIANIITFSLRGRGPGEHRKPMDVAVDREDFVWVVDTQNRRLQKYTAEGQFLFEFGEQTTGKAEGTTFAEPIAAAVDSENRLLVLDRLTGEILRFDDSGTFLDRFGKQGGGLGQFLHPEGLAVDALDRIYVADTLNSRIQGLNSEGSPLLVFGVHGSGVGEVHHPSGVAVDPVTKFVYLTDSKNHQLQIFDQSEQFIVEFGGQGDALGQFNRPFDVIVGKDQNIFISEVENNRVSWYSSTVGAPSGVTVLPPVDFTGKLFKQPHGVALDSQESILYVADTGNNRIVGIRIKRPADDTLSPRALISSPATEATVSGVVDVRGIAADAHFAEYQLEFGSGESPLSFAPIAFSSEPVWNDSLGLWDTRNLETGVYTLRLTVTDKSGNTAAARLTVQVEGTAPVLLVSVSAFPSIFMPDRGGTMVNYRLARNAAVKAMVVNPRTSRRVWTFEEAQPGHLGGAWGENVLTWDGRDEQGQPVPPGYYVVILVAEDGTQRDRKIVSLRAVPSLEAVAAALGGVGQPVVRGSGAGGTAGSPASSSATSSASHDRGVDRGKNPKDFERGDNPGQHKGEDPEKHKGNRIFLK